MTALLLTAAALVLAPVADAALRRRAAVREFADGMVQVAVAGLLLVHVVPAGLSAAGWPALVALAAGLGAGLLAHRLPNGERSILGLALAGLVLHGAADGVALATADHRHGATIEIAVILHSLPVGLATWRVAVGRAGPAAGVGALAILLAATVFGYVAAGPLIAAIPPGGLGVAECAVAGALLHVVGHLDRDRTPATGWGALAGLGLVGAIGWMPGEGHQGAAILEPAGHLALTGAPALVVGYGAAALLHARWPHRSGAIGGAAVALALAAGLLGPAVAGIGAGGALIAAATAAALGDGPPPGRSPQPPGPLAVVERTVAPLAVGLALAALVAPFLGAPIRGVPGPLAVVAAGALGLALPGPLAASPVAAAVIAAGAPAGAGAALLAAGLGAGSGWIALRAALAVAAGLAADALLPPDAAAPAIRALSVRSHGPIEIAAAWILGVPIAASLVRRGPSALLAPMLHRGPRSDPPPAERPPAFAP